MLSIVRACAVVGLDGCIIEVETDFNPRAGIPSFSLVGLPGSSVRESRERVRAAIRNSGLQFPNKSYVVNLSPADLPKHGPAYDLAIAVGVLAATDQVPERGLDSAIFLGELSLDGSVRHVKGMIAMVHSARDEGYRTVYVPAEDAPEAALIENLEVYPVDSLGQLVEHLYGLKRIAPHMAAKKKKGGESLPEGLVDFADIKGQDHLKRALEVAAAGNHNLLMKGAAGRGQVALRAGVARHSAAAHAGGSAGSHARLLGRGHAAQRGAAAAPPALSRAAPHHLAGRVGGGRPAAAAGRDFAGASRRAVPG